jgi:hypothetical protein
VRQSVIRNGIWAVPSAYVTVSVLDVLPPSLAASRCRVAYRPVGSVIVCAAGTMLFGVPSLPLTNSNGMPSSVAWPVCGSCAAGYVLPAPSKSPSPK